MTKDKQSVHVGSPAFTPPTMGVNRNACPYCGAKGFIVIVEVEQEVRMTCEDCGGTGVKRNAN